MQHQYPDTEETDKVYLPYSDQWNAELLVERYGDDIRYVYPWKTWLVWDGRHWIRDQSGAVMRRAKDTIRYFISYALDYEEESAQRALAHAKTSLNASRLEGMVRLTRSEAGIPLDPEELDADPWALNCENGILDLHTGELLPHRRFAYCSKMTPVAYNPDAVCPIWDAFLDRIMEGNKELISFLQRAIGYALTGDTSEQCIFILNGSGANGKSTFIETLHAVFADYGRQAEFSTFLTRRNDDGPRNDIAALHGARFVAANEVSEGKRLSEAVIKQMTGQDSITCRRFYEEFFTFKPGFKVFLACNHKPVIKGQDHAIWRRIRLIPFNVTIPDAEQDKDLQAKLRGELPGILAWAVRGCLAWQKYRLGTPPEVVEATAKYRGEMDSLSDFLNECCVIGNEYRVSSKALYEAYTYWCQENGEQPESQKAFGMRLNDRGFPAIKNVGPTKARGRQGIGLLIKSPLEGQDALDGSRPVIPENDQTTSPIESFRNNGSYVSPYVSMDDDPPTFFQAGGGDLRCPRCGRTDITFTALSYLCPLCGAFDPE